MERNSEGRMMWVVIGLVGAQLLGVDVGHIIGLLTAAQQGLDAAAAGKHTGVLSGDLSLPAMAAVYAWNRTKIKAERLKNDAASVMAAGGDTDASATRK